MKTDDAPVCEFTRSTRALPKSMTSRSFVCGWNASPRSRLLEPATLTWRFRLPSEPNTKSCPGCVAPVPVTANVVTKTSPCLSTVKPSGLAYPAGSVANLSTAPRSQAAASSGHKARHASTDAKARQNVDIGTSSSKGVDRNVPARSVLPTQKKRRPAGRLSGTSANGQLAYLMGISCASSRPLLLSMFTTITPSGGVTANSAELTEIVLLVSVAPGLTVTNPPSLTALENALYFAVPATILLPPFRRSKLTAWYVIRGLDADRQASVTVGVEAKQ